MRLEDAFKESDIPAAKRVENGYQVVIRYLPNNQGVLLRRVFPIDGNNTYSNLAEEEEIFPHLGALIYKAIKKRYTGVRRYAYDWQPLISAFGEKAQAARRAALEAKKKELDDYYHGYDAYYGYYEQKEELEDIEDEFTYVYSNGDEDNPYDVEMSEIYPDEFLDEYGYYSSERAMSVPTELDNEYT